MTLNAAFGANTEKFDIYEDYKTYYLRTQGKISFEDFMKYYYGPWATKSVSPKSFGSLTLGKGHPSNAAVTQVKELLINNSPKTFFEKAAVGQRVCLVLDNSDPLAKSLISKMKNLIFEHNVVPHLTDEQFFEQVKILFNEKAFEYGIKENGTVAGTKIVIPIFSYETDFLGPAEEKWNGQSVQLEIAEEKEWESAAANWKNHMGRSLFNMYSGMKTEYENLKNTINKEALLNPLKGALDPKLFVDLIPITMREAIVEAYGDKLKAIFNPTIREIIGQISLSNSAINKDWKSGTTLSTESPFSGDGSAVAAAGDADELNFADGSAYLPLIFASLPIVIQAAATYSDPTWRTPWFWPGPQTPLGFLAKIL